MNRKENREAHNLYWGKVLNIFKQVDPSRITLEQLWGFTCYSEITNNFSLDVNSFDYSSLENVEILNGYNPEFKSMYPKYYKEKLELVTSEIPKDTTQIVDLGSGWGRYSVLLSKMHPEKKIFSLENSDSGVQACKLLREKYNLCNLVCGNFDYHDPIALQQYVIPLSEKQNAFFFSSYSIEQIPTLDRQMFDIVLGAKYNEVKCFHIEPIGWQVRGTPKNTIDRYNNNLYPLLKSLESQSLIKIIKTEVDIYGKRGNPGTIITWKKI
jgi:hypothetical protein